MKLAVVARTGARFAWLWRHRMHFTEGLQVEQPRLLVDVSCIIRHDAQTGIQRVVRSVWSELGRRNGDGFSLHPVFASQTHGYCLAPDDFLDRPLQPGARPPVRVRPGDKIIGLDLSAHVLPKYRQQLRNWRRHGATVHLVVYDLLPLLRPQWFSRRASSNFRNWVKILLEECDQAICISKQVSRDLRQCLRDRDHSTGLSIATIRLGGDLSGSRPTTGMLPQTTHLLDRLRFRPAILMVGTIEPRKGYEVALAAFEGLWRRYGSEAPDLVIVGKAGWKTDALQRRLRLHSESGQRLHWLEDVSDEGLGHLYQACRGLLVASFAEGFGLTLAEAVMHGRPVLARDLPVFQEQALPNVEFFDDDRPRQLGEAVMKLARTGAAPSATQGDLPSWGECVQELLSAVGVVAQAQPTSKPNARVRP